MADAGSGSGQHKIIDIADILQSLGNKRWTGTLQVMSRGRNVYLFFREGVIQHSRADTSKVVLGRALFKLGKLDEADLNLALNDFENAGKKLGQVCVDLGLVKPDDIRDALAFQAREGVLDLFTWEDVDARFHPGEPPLPSVFGQEDTEIKLGLSPMGLLMEAARRADEWEMVKAELPSLDEVLAPTNPEGAPGVSMTERRVLALVDGYRTAGEIADAAPTANFEALKQLAELLKKGQLRRLEAVDLARVALEAERASDLDKALRLYLLAQGRGLGDRVDLAKRIARALQLLGRTEESLEHWLDLAKRCEDAKRPDQATEAYRAALALDPVRLEAHERLAGLLVLVERKDEAVKQLSFLIEQLGRAEPKDAARLVRAHEQLLELAPDDEKALRRLAELHAEQSDKVHAIVRLDELAQCCLARGARDEAVTVYYRLLEIDDECLEGRLALAQCLAQLGSTDDAVREYKRLADTLYRSGLIANQINWSFLFKVYESIVEIEPSSTPAWEWLAKAYAENGQTDLAVSRYLGMAQSLEPKDESTPPSVEILAPLKRVVELAPGNTDTRRRLAHALAALDRTAEAVRALHELAETHVAAGVPHAAIEALEEALHADPFHVDSRRLAADLRERGGERALALKAWTDLGGLCLRAGLGSEACDAFRRAHALAGDEPGLLAEWARAEEERGRMPEAAQLLQRLAAVEQAAENAGRARAALERARELSRHPSRSSGRLATQSTASMPALPPLPAAPAPPGSSGRYPRPDLTPTSAASPTTTGRVLRPGAGSSVSPDAPTKSFGAVAPPTPPLPSS